jgi:small subunit ribosomal protein S19e
MASIHDVEPIKLIEKVAKDLAKSKEIQMPVWATFVKTGVHKERPPVQENWWTIRAAAILRTIYNKGPIGVSKLRSKYGGAKNRGLKPNKFKKGSGKIIRIILQQLDSAGLTKLADKGKGRILTPKGQALLDNSSNQLLGKSKKKVAEKPIKSKDLGGQDNQDLAKKGAKE